MIRDRQSAINKVERHDLFTKLLEANDDDLGQKSMTEDELIGSFSILTIFFKTIWNLMDVSGNMYIFLLAGHEVGNPHLLFRRINNFDAFWLDNGTYFGLHICTVGIIPWWTGEALWTDQVCYQRAPPGMSFWISFTYVPNFIWIIYIDLWGNASSKLFHGVRTML